MHFKRQAKFITTIIISCFIILAYSNYAAAKIRNPLKANIISSSLEIKIISHNDKNVIVDIMVNPMENNINLVGTYINFENKKLILKNINLENSFCNLFIENTINNENGEAKISCGLPFPGITTQATVARLEFEKISEASTIISFNKNSLVLANDGYGTNVLKTSNFLEIN